MESQVTATMVSESVVIEEHEAQNDEENIDIVSSFEASSRKLFVGPDTNVEPSSDLPETSAVVFADQPTHGEKRQSIGPLHEADDESVVNEDYVDEIKDSRAPHQLDGTTVHDADYEDIKSDSIVSAGLPSEEDKDESHSFATAPSVSASVDFDKTDVELEDSPAAKQKKRPTRKRGRPPKGVKVPTKPAHNDTKDEITVKTRQTQSHDAGSSQPDSPDTSVRLARHSIGEKRPKKEKAHEPVRTSPRVTRARSSSFQKSASPEDERDRSISLAKASIASPSKSTSGGHHRGGSISSLKLDLTKRLRSELKECVNLKNLRNHVEKFPNVVAIVTTQPPPPARAKGGPREYVMSFNITDPSLGPGHVAEVQLYRPHKESLPQVKPGDGILLQRFQVKALSKKGWGLRSHAESAYAVFEADAEHETPQIKGPPVEDYDIYANYMAGLREWYKSLDVDSMGKLEKANRKFDDINHSK